MEDDKSLEALKNTVLLYKQTEGDESKLEEFKTYRVRLHRRLSMIRAGMLDGTTDKEKAQLAYLHSANMIDYKDGKPYLTRIEPRKGVQGEEATTYYIRWVDLTGRRSVTHFRAKDTKRLTAPAKRYIKRVEGGLTPLELKNLRLAGYRKEWEDSDFDLDYASVLRRSKVFLTDSEADMVSHMAGYIQLLRGHIQTAESKKRLSDWGLKMQEGMLNGLRTKSEVEAFERIGFMRIWNMGMTGTVISVDGKRRPQVKRIPRS